MLNVAVQMDPIERINIRGDSTFALLLEAQARGHSLSYYTPDRLMQRDGAVAARVQPLQVRDVAGEHFSLGEALGPVARQPDIGWRSTAGDRVCVHWKRIPGKLTETAEVIGSGIARQGKQNPCN